MGCSTMGWWAVSAGPGRAGAASGTGSTGRAVAKLEAVSAGLAICRSGTCQPKRAAIASSRAGSSSRKNGGRCSRSRRSQACRAISPPMPAGSPMVRASGAGATGSAEFDGGIAAQVLQIPLRQLLGLAEHQPLPDLVEIKGIGLGLAEQGEQVGGAGGDKGLGGFVDRTRTS